jgi:hypothetical protein
MRRERRMSYDPKNYEVRVRYLDKFVDGSKHAPLDIVYSTMVYAATWDSTRSVLCVMPHAGDSVFEIPRERVLRVDRLRQAKREDPRLKEAR